MGIFRSSEQKADITWTDTQTGQQHTTTDCYVFPRNGGTFETHATTLIAVSELGGLRDKDRVRIDRIHRKP